jgi:hypothetical protein
MPQLLIFTAVGLGLTLAWRLVRREMDRVEETLAEVRVPTRTNAPARLVRGADGVFRPETRDRGGR